MSDPSRGISPWWVLLILPVAPAAGWLIGNLSGAEKPAAVSPAGAAIPPPGSGGRMGGPAAGIAVTQGHDPAPPPAPTPEPRRDETPAEYSSWTTIESALSQSRRSGKPVMIDFSADWCPPCQRLKREVFDDGTHGRVVQETVIPVSVVDRTREEGRNPSWIEDLQRQYGVEAFPTLVVFSPVTGRIEQTRGFGGADATLEWIRDAAKAVR